MISARKENCPFAMLVYQLLVVEKRHTIDEMARELRLSYSALHSRLNNRTRFSPTEVRRLIGLIDDERLLKFFIDGSGYILGHRPLSTAASGDTVRRAVANAIRQAIDVVLIASSVLEKTTPINHYDRTAILKEVDEAETALADLRTAIDRNNSLSTG